jgi:hypothetical protein
MKLPKNQLEPIMTNADNITQLGPNAYAKPATALTILRETIMGCKLFDAAFKEYARRWAFKHPTPADLFRTLEDASAEDLDWFWRGWFYSTDACDISLDSVRYATVDVNNVPVQRDTMVHLAKPLVNAFEDILKIRNRQDTTITFSANSDTSLQDFYWRYDRGLVPYDTTKYATRLGINAEGLDDETKQKYTGKHFYELQFSNKGGLVMPIIIEWTYKDGSKEVDRIPAQVWRLNENKVIKFFMKDKEVASIKLDPMRETADIDETNNSWGNTVQEPSRLQLFKINQAVRGKSTGPNPMQKAAEKKASF